MNIVPPTYKNHRFPIEIVARVIWLYLRSKPRFQKTGTVTLTWPRTQFDLYALFQAVCGHAISRHTLAAAWRRSR